ncbi:MAG: hypothetical protein E6G94_13540 [Alphaproteobacteria bacterium]|nr:MAG: hypothetical protein E6G94_13540 [Alphaproteobacteria bacterium]
MRDLHQFEIGFVSGAGSSPTPPSCGCECPETGGKKHKNNNGYGNGPESGPPPGHSGDHNPQLTTWNSGPKGPR